MHRAGDAIFDVALTLEGAAVVEVNLDGVDQGRRHDRAAEGHADQLPGVHVIQQRVRRAFVHGLAEKATATVPVR